MIAVVGRLNAGSAGEIARRAAAQGAPVELVAKVPDGSSGDRHLLELATAGVGHAAALRSGTPALEPADLQLALRYLPDLKVVVLASDAAVLAATAADAAGWAGAALVVIADAELDLDPPDAMVLEAPPSDPDGAFAGVVAALAARLDAGEDPATAWRRVTADLSVDPVSRSAARDPGRPAER